jgi:hypothetical protein
MTATLFNLRAAGSARRPKREVLDNIPPRRGGESLQVYFW